jgi:glycosyltransferase involved in cell wall biosynthesis
MMNVMITGPSLDDPGGVANYYRAVLPVLARGGRVAAGYVAIGSGGGQGVTRFVRDQWRVHRELASRQPQLVHVNPSLNFKSFVRDGLLIRQAKMRGLPVLVFFRGWSDDFAATEETRWRTFFRLTYGRADAFIVLASAFERRLRAWGVGAPIHLHTTVVDESLISGHDVETRAAEVASADPLRILFMSRVVESKGVFDILDALQRLLARGRQLSLTVAGSGEALDRVRAVVMAQEELRRRVEFTGYVSGEQKRNVLQRHHIFCLPTYHGEGLPNAVLEALASGMGVVTSPAGGLADLFADQRMGLLVRPRDPEHLAARLDELLSDRKRLEGMAAFGQAYARDHFLAGTVAEALTSVYAQVLSACAESGEEASERVSLKG